MKYKLLPRRVSLLVYDDSSDTNYVATCQININGTHGTIDTLNGKDFYTFFKEYDIKPFKELGLTEIKAAVTDAHYRLLKRAIGDVADITIEERFVSNNIPLLWINILEKKIE